MYHVTWRRRGALAAIGVAAAIALSACGSSGSSGGGSNAASGDSSSVSIDVGTGTPVKVAKPMKLAYVTYGTASSSSAAGLAAAKAYGASHNLDITTFDPGGDAKTQFNQIQNAIHSGRYNAIAVLPVDPNLICNLLSKDAPKANIVVSVFTQAPCGRFAAVGNGAWQPGTMNFVSGFQSRDTMLEWLNEMAKEYPGKQTVGLISGLPTDAESRNLDHAVEVFKKSHPDYTFVPELRTNYTTTGGYQTAQNLLQSHPEVTVIMSDYSDVSVGIAHAIKQAGKLNTVHVVDYGGSKAILPLLKAGSIGLTLPIYPKKETDKVLDLLVDAFNGQKVPRYTALPLHTVDSKNADSFTPGF